MSEKISAESGTTENTESGNTETIIKADRSAEEYAARLVEVSAENKKFRESNKALKAQMDDLSSKFSKLNEERMKEQGNYQEAWTKTKSELEAERDARKREKQAYAYKVVSSQLEAEAAKTGCLNPQAFVKVAKADGLINDLEVNDEFEVDPNSLKSTMEKAQKEYSFLFGKPTPSVRDGVPSGNQQIKPLQKSDLANQSMDKLLEMAKRL
jgi:chromosome segregation ATPase